MREIKFKAKLYKTNKIYDVIDISWISDTKVLVTLQMDEDTGECFEFPIEGELIQYINVKDRNNKEIYEGDIVEEGSIGEKIWDGEGIIKQCPVGIVEWDCAGFNIRQIKKGLVNLNDGSKSEVNLNTYDGLFQWYEAVLEIIGNESENPELLKEKNEKEEIS